MHSPRVLFFVAICAIAVMVVGCSRSQRQSRSPAGPVDEAGQMEAEAPAEGPEDEGVSQQAEPTPEESVDEAGTQETEAAADKATENEGYGSTGPSETEKKSNQPSNTTEEDTSMPIEVSSQDFEEKVINADVPVLVDFWAPWCGPCQMMHPVLEELAEEYEGRAVIARLNIDEGNNQELARKYEVRAIPFMAIFNDGEIEQQLVGVRPEDELRDALDEAIGG